MALVRGSDIDASDRMSPLDMVRMKKSASRVDASLVDEMIAAGDSIDSICSATGATRHFVAVAIERWLRRNPRFDIVRVHVSPERCGDIEEALLYCGGSIKKTHAALQGCVDPDLIHIFRGYCVGSTGY